MTTHDKSRSKSFTLYCLCKTIKARHHSGFFCRIFSRFLLDFDFPGKSFSFPETVNTGKLLSPFLMDSCTEILRKRRATFCTNAQIRPYTMRVSCVSLIFLSSFYLGSYLISFIANQTDCLC